MFGKPGKLKVESAECWSHPHAKRKKSVFMSLKIMIIIKIQTFCRSSRFSCLHAQRRSDSSCRELIALALYIVAGTQRLYQFTGQTHSYHNNIVWRHGESLMLFG